ncbi:beta-ribofuranosylaminobenzene 5'-phosphate synthase family protein [Halalkalicoccus jeotgali]|uniref:Beta-ribofuranosylaminobenzene 5'-phosphate synthase n=1 Tax=Halalkalicoccus jeotgali (strain DSM 18796 / CECT 7217 / JCM 14584 / KCTC 4019 / B3) TaxID=795797 RepID=D8JA40_HALJB|nr:beta-ribofuranosylaminobenzene 5'-phosphate synthase family protein [Halalkalicoccus jeotgali]ADJ14562.1 GHMP kinase putative ATP-binding protein [Halalkalicoccus jeotgali B3]ELY39934.1 GHMP kinase putative ATP-binding protein [Halalkalicoccus jeotgali B3]
MTVRVTTGGRLHFGFQNLSLAHERLYGSLGLALSEPRAVVECACADAIRAQHPDAERYARRAVEILDVPGAHVTVNEVLPRHAGLGSGTQLSLAVLAGIARAYGREPRIEDRAPLLGRGGRSGVGIATFREGGFVCDGGHPATRFTAERPRDGTWEVPPIVARHPIPEEWRFVLVIPDLEPGRSGTEEDADMRAVVERASPAVADEITAIGSRQVLPAIVEEDLATFGAGVAEIGRLNGAWYADAQGGVYRPPIGTVVRELEADRAVVGAGQSSWGPVVYGVTDREGAAGAREAGERALSRADIGGNVRVVAGRNTGARID